MLKALPARCAARVARREVAFALSLLTASAGCSDDDPPGGSNSGGSGNTGGGGTNTPGGAAGTSAEVPAFPPPLREPVTLDDGELARQALSLLGSSAVGAEGSCRNCHSVSRPTLTRWSQLTLEFSNDCLANPSLETQTQVDAMYACVQDRASKARALEPGDFGIYATAAHLPWFSYLYRHASELSTDWEAERERFIERVGMPRAGERWTQAQFDLVAEWFSRGTPQLFELVPEDAGEACTPGIDPALLAHVEEMQTRGWRAKNEEALLPMFGCEAAQSGSECLSEFPLASDEGATSWDVIPGSRIVLLHDNTGARSTYWSRSSADGRYIGSGLLDPNGSGFSGQILDLADGATIDADFAYDATFFPDNSGFILQQASVTGGSGNDERTLVCDQSVLVGNPARVTGDEDECVLLEGQIGLYQQPAKSIDGDDYWVVHGAYESDDGGFFEPVLQNPSAPFDSDSVQALTPMINLGDRFEAGAEVRVETPRQGDPTLSPSGRLLVTRVKGREVQGSRPGTNVVTAEQSGYALHQVTTNVTASGASATLQDVGRICLTGGKATFSFDERWMVLYHYVTDADAVELGFGGPGDPGFADYADLGASNLYLVDLRDGSARRITDVEPGQYALFPHFRSDGWIYFVVRTLAGGEFFAASDTALIAAGE